MACPTFLRDFTYSLLFFMCLTDIAFGCPVPCSCAYGEVAEDADGHLFITNCSKAELKYIPDGIPNVTQYLDLSSNRLGYASENRLQPLLSLRYLDLRNNSNLQSIPTMQGLNNLTKIYVDAGPTCCIYEVEWERIAGISRRKMAANLCMASSPYTECDRHLISIPSIVSYAVTVLLSLAFNPWVFVVTLVHRGRRKDPITLINAHFTVSSLLITVYASGILVIGVCFYDSYPYHMEDWLENPGCAVLGYIMITASLACTVFYTLEIIMIFLKVCYPCDHNKHMTVMQLNIAVAVTWVVAVGVASIPFGFGRYNAVGLCLPFYSGDYDFSFKYVLLYTALTNMTTIVNMVMHVNVLRLFIQKAKENKEHVCEQRRKENRNLRNTVIITLVFSILISLSEMVFLIMSCIGGNLGQIGREWWARMVILEAVINPLTGPMRKKRFFRDTKVLIKRFKNRYNHHDNRRSSVISKIAIDLNKRNTTNQNGKSKNKTPETDSATIKQSEEKIQMVEIDNSKFEGCEKDSHKTTLRDVSLNGDLSPLEASPERLQKIFLKRLKESEKKLGASPVSQSTLETDISDDASEKSI